MADDDDHHHSFFSSPEALYEAINGEREMHRLARRDAENEVHEFFESLSVKQLITLRRILNLDQESASNNFMDGQILTLLRVQRRVNTTTGRSFEDEFQETVTSPPNDTPGA